MTRISRLSATQMAGRRKRERKCVYVSVYVRERERGEARGGKGGLLANMRAAAQISRDAYLLLHDSHIIMARS